MKKNLLAFIHWLIIAFIYTAFIWADWRWILVGVVVYWAQIIVFKACILSIVQYKNRETSFVGLNINNFIELLSLQKISMKKIRLFLDWVLPIIFLVLAYILQNSFDLRPIFQFSF